MPLKLRKEFFPDLKHFLCNFTLIYGSTCTLILSLISIPSLSATAVPEQAKNLDRADGKKSLFQPNSDRTILTGLDFLYRMEYSSADSAFNTLPDQPARLYFRGLALINRFSDLGDSAALSQAENCWSQIKVPPTPKGNFELYQGLAELQLSYAAGIRGNRIRSANLGRVGVSKLRAFPEIAEAKAGIALYDYYKASMLKGFAWMPFTSLDASIPLAQLEKAVPQSRYLREVLQISLLWLYYDRGQFEKGLEFIQPFLDQYPQSRLYRQVKADFLFRKGDLDSALAIHLDLLQEYQILSQRSLHPPCLPLGRLSSVGNLAKIYAAKNEKAQLQSQLQIWKGKEFDNIKGWLPSSLKREVESLKF